MLKHSIMVIALALGSAAFAQDGAPPPADGPQPTPVAPAPPEAAVPAAAPSPEQAAASQQLVAKGYSEVQELVKQGNDWRGAAMHEGKRVQVTLMPDGTTRHTPLG